MSGRPTSDAWRPVRWALLGLLGVVFAWSFWRNGLPVARLAVLGWVAAAFVVGNVGRPLRRQLVMAGDLALYAAMWLAYDLSRGMADVAGFPLQVEAPRNIDRALLLGVDPSVWLQDRLYDAAHVRWYDVVGSLVYMTHFFVPVAASVYLWIRFRPDWVRFMRRFATVLGLGVALYVTLPTVPPWMASSHRYPYRILEPLARPTGRGWGELGLTTVSRSLLHGQQWANPTAAMPSLHAALALFVVVFFWPRVHSRWLHVAMAAFPVAMALTLVYFAEHYVIDILAGWLCVGVSFWGWGWWERRQAQRVVATDERGERRGVAEPSSA